LKEPTRHPADVLGFDRRARLAELSAVSRELEAETALAFFCIAAFFSDGKPDPTKDRAIVKAYS
jgi:hypothetical protein